MPGWARCYRATGALAPSPEQVPVQVLCGKPGNREWKGEVSVSEGLMEDIWVSSPESRGRNSAPERKCECLEVTHSPDQRSAFPGTVQPSCLLLDTAFLSSPRCQGSECKGGKGTLSGLPAKITQASSLYLVLQTGLGPLVIVPAFFVWVSSFAGGSEN